jgi:3-deoxy-D-manno-octulosonic-acid transferase
METELWPNWLAMAQGAGIKTAFLNGRISSRTIRSYRRLRPLLAPLLASVNAFSMSSASDADRIKRLGAPPERVFVNGNVKMDARRADRDTVPVRDLKRVYAVKARTPVFVAGSVRGAEAEALMEVCLAVVARIPEVVIILAPRHIEKASRFAGLATSKGLSFHFRTDLETSPTGRVAPLVILDTIGELRHVYSLATVAFCGASLVPLGGQNVLEPALWGKPVLYGPSMEDFEEARQLLEQTGGGVCVRDADDLTHRVIDLLMHPHEARRLGVLARRAILANQGAAHRHAQVILDLLAVRPEAVPSS